MSSLPSPRRSGVLLFWHLSEHGGFGKILVPATEESFFVHRNFITSGEPVVGSSVSFIPVPAPEGRKHPQATDCIIDNTQLVRQSTCARREGVR